MRTPPIFCSEPVSEPKRKFCGVLGPVWGLALTIALGACARPKYYNPSSAPAPSTRAQFGLTCQTRFEKSDLCVDFAWEKNPTETEPGSLLLKTFRPNLADQSPLIVDPVGKMSTAQLHVELWMPSMGHGSTPVTLVNLDTGTFRASELFFIMKGHWEIRIQLKDGETVVDQGIIPVAF